MRHIPDIPGCAAGSDGSIWCCRKRGFGFGLFGAWKQRKVTTRGSYRYLTITIGGVKGLFTVHGLVATSFHGVRPDGLCCRHLDGNSLNNAATNLKWGTRLENEADKQLHGTTARGTRQGSARFTDSEVINIRRLYGTGKYTEKSLGELLGVPKSTIHNITSGTAWRHLLSAN